MVTVKTATETTVRRYHRVCLIYRTIERSHCVVLWLLTVSFVFHYIILCVINYRRTRNKLPRSYKKEMSSCAVGIGALLK